MTSHNPNNTTYYIPCHPEQFAVFKRGDKALCLNTFANSDWVYGPPPQAGKVYIVRDFHFGTVADLRDGKTAYGQILNLEGVVCDRVAQAGGLEWGWFYAQFRKITDQEAEEIARAENTVEAKA